MKDIKLAIFAGVNGAGKSTLYNMLGKDFGFRLNSDEIVHDNKWDWRNEISQFEAGKLLLKKQAELLSNKQPFNRETTLCGRSILRLIDEAKADGYFVELFYVGVASPDIAIKRVEEREKRGGHGVSVDTVEKRFDNSIENLKSVFSKCDIVHLYDNTVSMREICFYKNSELTCAISSYDWENDASIKWVKDVVSLAYGDIKIKCNN